MLTSDRIPSESRVLPEQNIIIVKPSQGFYMVMVNILKIERNCWAKTNKN